MVIGHSCAFSTEVDVWSDLVWDAGFWGLTVQSLQKPRLFPRMSC